MRRQECLRPLRAALWAIWVFGHLAGPAATPSFDVTSFGAAGGDDVDDTAAFVAAVAAAAAAGGGTVHVPAGTYLVEARVPDTPIIRISTSGLRLVGAGIGQSVIRLPDDAEDYNCIVGSDDVRHDLSGLEIAHLTFDHNVAGNPRRGPADVATHRHKTINVLTGSDIHVHDVEIRNAASTRLIQLASNAGRMKRVRIQRVRVGDVGNPDGANGFVADSSIIYTHAAGVRISGCLLRSAGAGTSMAATAIETHGSHHVVADNEIHDFRRGIIATGISTGPSRDVELSRNAIHGCQIGIDLRSQKGLGQTAGPGLDGVLVHKNSIQVAPTGTWGPSATTALGGIVVDANSDLDIRRLRITDNTIRGAPEATAVAANSSSMAIGWAPRHDVRLLESTLADNTVVDFPMAAIRLGPALHDVVVRSNLLHDTASTGDTRPSVATRTPMMIWVPSIDGLHLENNWIVDSHDPTRITYGVYLGLRSDAGKASRFVVRDTKVQLAGARRGGFRKPFHVEAGDPRPRFEGDVNGVVERP